MIPEEDRGPAWLRDYGYADFGQIEADIQAMERFAATLADLRKGDPAKARIPPTSPQMMRR